MKFPNKKNRCKSAEMGRYSFAHTTALASHSPQWSTSRTQCNTHPPHPHTISTNQIQNPRVFYSLLLSIYLNCSTSSQRKLPSWSKIWVCRLLGTVTWTLKYWPTLCMWLNIFLKTHFSSGASFILCRCLFFSFAATNLYGLSFKKCNNFFPKPLVMCNFPLPGFAWPLPPSPLVAKAIPSLDRDCTAVWNGHLFFFVHPQSAFKVSSTVNVEFCKNWLSIPTINLPDSSSGRLRTVSAIFCTKTADIFQDWNVWVCSFGGREMLPLCKVGQVGFHLLHGCSLLQACAQVLGTSVWSFATFRGPCAPGKVHCSHDRLLEMQWRTPSISGNFESRLFCTVSGDKWALLLCGCCCLFLLFVLCQKARFSSCYADSQAEMVSNERQKGRLCRDWCVCVLWGCSFVLAHGAVHQGVSLWHLIFCVSSFFNDKMCLSSGLQTWARLFKRDSPSAGHRHMGDPGAHESCCCLLRNFFLLRDKRIWFHFFLVFLEFDFGSCTFSSYTPRLGRILHWQGHSCECSYHPGKTGREGSRKKGNSFLESISALANFFSLCRKQSCVRTPLEEQPPPLSP